jgi:hypothetical protein
LTVTRKADGKGVVNFAGSAYACGRQWARRDVQVAIVAGSVQLAVEGRVVRVHPIRHDRAKELGAYAHPLGHPGRIAKKAQAAAARLATGVKDLPNSDGQAATGD